MVRSSTQYDILSNVMLSPTTQVLVVGGSRDILNVFVTIFIFVLELGAIDYK
jgi:hypothetical protein